MNNNFEATKAACIGKWPGIFDHYGISVGTGRHTCCPICSPGEPKSDRFRFIDKDGTGSFFCNQCSPQAGDGISLVMKILNIDYKTCMNELAKIVGTVEATPYQKEKPVDSTLLRKLCVESTPIVNSDLVALYLKSRGLKDLPVGLRYHKNCYEAETKQGQHAMLTIFHDKDGQAATIHRTYLSPAGNKLDIKSPKKMMPPKKKMSGGAARLYPFEDGILGIAEGIETAIACHDEANIPVWAALSATLLEKFQCPKNVKDVLIFSDNDLNFTGQRAAYNLAHRLYNEGINVKVEVPIHAGTDFLNEFAGQT